MSLISIYIGGVLTLAMALFHTRFYRLFKWQAEYEKLSLANQRIFYTIHVALLLQFFLIGIVTLVYATELSDCQGLACGVNLVMALFWVWRFVWQLLYFKVKTGTKIPPIVYILDVWFFLLFVSYLVPVVVRFL
ncbi:hypothetical protein JW960_06000 [candidate division KSB1 bacterium]|nr:hypothetical protein [candidate division KSB1 bacterium]